jgi:hypothetical protein
MPVRPRKVNFLGWGGYIQVTPSGVSGGVESRKLKAQRPPPLFFERYRRKGQGCALGLRVAGKRGKFERHPSPAGWPQTSGHGYVHGMAKDKVPVDASHVAKGSPGAQGGRAPSSGAGTGASGLPISEADVQSQMFRSLADNSLEFIGGGGGVARVGGNYRTLFTSIDEGFCVIEMLFDEQGKPNDWRLWR